ncbi:transcriptional regulator, AraC family [Methylocella silvestris BL2]|uniref:Transcriptional regulator, AraC family n=1 Tax=Methylocella silvestris (strain DSM 15510 / CIP 108128 / LMG 27833 / NCIMB 13906 / BL2) TaxID=395965 RepID=B8EQ93_METSB|nr:helix-turn-helix transcriptional regulator [Methylocella silvestris]ACK51583.1 transcriptional regulator, AraC family [Methylocella silvestris BL2]
MSLTVFRPSPALAPYIYAYWDYKNLTGKTDSSLSILPDTATYLCFLYQDLLVTAHKTATYRIRSGLAGFQSFRSDLGGDGVISGVSARLTPWGLNVFRRGAAKECAEGRVDCRDVFPRYAIERIEDDLARIATAQDRIARIERYLLSVFNPQQEDATVRWACDRLLALRGDCRIVDLAKGVGLSKRALERRFVNHIGATPKKLSRVIRLRNAVFQKKRLGSWAEVAHDVGFYDQSHMIHDFLELYGMTPEELYPRVHISPTFRFSGLLDLSPAAPRSQ